jgi:hypothetical protein
MRSFLQDAQQLGAEVLFGRKVSMLCSAKRWC